MNHDKHPKPGKVVDLDAFRQKVHPEIEPGAELTDIFATEFPDDISKDKIVQKLLKEVSENPALNSQYILIRALEELSIIDSMDDIMQSRGKFKSGISYERIDRLKELNNKLPRLQKMYAFMQRDGELRIEHELRIAYQKIIAFTAKTTDSFALIQVLNELIQALPGNIAAQDAYRLGVFLLEYYAEFEDADA